MGTNYFELYKDIWNFHKKYQQEEVTEKYWQNLLNESDSIADKYNEDIFVTTLLLAVIDELRRHKH